MSASLSRGETTAGGRDRSLRVLVTGFGPFPGAPQNPTAALAQGLARHPPPGLGAGVSAHVFATSYAAVDAGLPGLLAARPDVVLMFGLAARTPFLRLELLARNARTVLLSDAAGRLPAGRGILPGGPPQRRGRAPFVPLLVRLQALRLPVRLSRNAGRYLCNYAYWRALEAGPRLVLFVHVPALRRGARVTAAELRRAGEALLRLLVAAARRPCAVPGQAARPGS